MHQTVSIHILYMYEMIKLHGFCSYRTRNFLWKFHLIISGCYHLFNIFVHFVYVFIFDTIRCNMVMRNLDTFAWHIKQWRKKLKTNYHMLHSQKWPINSSTKIRIYYLFIGIDQGDIDHFFSSSNFGWHRKKTISFY